MAKNATIGALKVALGLDSAQFESGLKSAQGKLGGFGKLAAVGFAAAGVAAAAAGAAIAVGFKSAIDAADNMLIASQKIGVGVEALSALKYAAELSAVSFDSLQTGLKKLSVNMASAASDVDGKAAGAFRSLGVSVTDATGQLRGSDAVFADVAERFSKMQDGAGKTALAVQLFGKAGADLIPLLNEGKGGLAEMTAEAEALGLIISTKTAMAAESFNDNLDRLKMVGSGVSNQLAGALAPALNDVTAGLVQAIKGAGFMDGIGKVLAVTLKTLATGALIVAQTFSNLGRAISTVAKAVTQVFQGDFAGAFETLKSGIAGNLQGLATMAGSIKTMWTGVGAQTRAVADDVSDKIAAPITQAAGKAKAARKDIESEADKAIKALRDRLAAERAERANDGLDDEMIKRRRLLADANAALKLGQTELADSFIELATSAAVSRDELQKVAEIQGDLVKLPAAAASATLNWYDDLEARIEAAADAFYQIGQAVDDVFYGFKNNDWVAAFSGLFRAISQLKDAFKDLKTEAGKATAITAAAGVASAAGNAIGGKAGAALSGAASGAVVGAQIGSIVPGVGTVIGAGVGAVLGGIASLFGGGSKKKKARREAEEKARLEAERRAAELAAAKRELELQLLERTEGALATETARRQDLLAAMDPSLRALQEEIWLRDDAAKAAAEAADKVATRLALERQLLALQDAEAAIAADRADALAGLDPASRAVQQAIYDIIDAQDALAEAETEWSRRQADADDRVAQAREALADAAEAEADRLGDVAERFGELADGIADLRRELDKGGLGAFGPRAQLAAARAAFDAVAGKTDEASLAALPQAARDLIAAETAVATNRQSLNAVFVKVRQALAAGEAAARAQVTDAQKQLAALNTQTDVLLGIQSGVVSVATAIAGLSNALFDQASVMGQALQALDAMATQAASFDARTVEAALTPPPGPPPAAAINDNTAFVNDLSVALAESPVFQQLVVNTGATARYLDDVTQGGDALRTSVV